MYHYKKYICSIFIFVICGFSLKGQAQIQSPTEYLGYELGSQWTPHHKVVDYFWHLADNSQLIKAKEYGETYEGRQLMLAYVSSEQNISQLQKIRRNNLRRTGLLEGKFRRDSTVIVWLSYNVHGDETSSSEAAMKTVYELVRPGNAKTKQWLRNTVVIMDPMLNPDGRDRYVHWYKETVGEKRNIFGEAQEHHQPWPGGRTNHYYFDLNRDWAWLTQKESRQRIVEYQKWMPHLLADYHEQGYTSPYYFPPPDKPFHNAMTAWQLSFQYTVGQNNAKYFDENDWLYFTREIFDPFYPSYGASYPMNNGAIGMTYEQAGGGYAGLGIQKPEGDTLTLDDRLIHHHVTGLSTIEISSQNAGKLLQEFSDYYQKAQNQPEGRFKTYVIGKNNNTDKLQSLFSLLNKHNISYGQATDSQNLKGYNYQSGQIEQVQINEGDYLVSSYQPKSVLVRMLFEPQPQLSDSMTYDITAWGQHYAYGLDGAALTQRMDLVPTSGPEKKIDNSATGTPYAYLLEWKDFSDIKMLATLLKQDIKVRFARKDFTIKNRKFESGTLIITRTDNKKKGQNFDQLVQKIATKHGEQLSSVYTGFVQSGTDFGSSSVRYIKKPRVALLSGEGTYSGMVGEIWHYFDKQINYPLTRVGTNYFEDIALDKFDVLILPSGSYGSKIDEKRMSEIKEWISLGGKLIALRNANDFLTDNDGFNLKRKKKDKKQSQGPKTNPTLNNFGERQRESISHNNPGSIYKVTMDDSHPLAFGYDENYFSLKRGSDSFAYLEDGWNVGVTKEGAHMSGFVGYKVKEDIQNSLTFGVQNMGSGSVVYMIDNPLFRAFWYDGKLLFANAVFLLGN